MVNLELCVGKSEFSYLQQNICCGFDTYLYNYCIRVTTREFLTLLLVNNKGADQPYHPYSLAMPLLLASKLASYLVLKF